MGDPVLCTKLLEEGVVSIMMDILTEVSPSELVACEGFAKRPHGFCMIIIMNIASSGCTSVDFTKEWLSCGYIDLTLSTLRAAKELGADHLHGGVVAWVRKRQSHSSFLWNAIIYQDRLGTNTKKTG
jgi:hypothetical protein